MMKYDVVKQYEIEPNIDDFIPDAFARWKGSRWFIEVQNSLYTSKQLEQKLKKWKINKKLTTSEFPFRIAQIESIDTFMKQVQIQISGVKIKG